VFYARGINHYNVVKQHSNVVKRHSTIHAEVDAINHLRYTTKRTKVNLFVFRTNPKGNRLMMAKPCEHCMKYIYTNIQRKGYRLHRIYYTDWDGDIVHM
jgi:cytidine deaminase